MTTLKDKGILTRVLHWLGLPCAHEVYISVEWKYLQMSIDNKQLIHIIFGGNVSFLLEVDEAIYQG